MLRQVDLKLLELPPHILDLAEYFTVFGLKLILVGGASRDFFLKGAKPRDYDMEVRSFSKSLRNENWQEYLHEVIESLKALDYTYEKLPFEIYRLTHKEFGEVEIASPRVEEYFGGVDFGAFGHSDFLATTKGEIDDALAFRRRDFTINAIGIDLMTGIVHDPFGGIEHIKQKILQPCFEHFFFDPVRLLRLIRFKLQLGFELSPYLEKNIGKFSLLKCSTFYLDHEANKTNSLLFLKNLFELEQVRLPKHLDKLKAVLKFPQEIENAQKITNTWQLFFYLIFYECYVGEVEQFCLLMGDIFKFPKKDMSQIVQQKSDIEEVKNLKKEYFNELAKKGSLVFCKDGHVFALARLINYLERSDLRERLELFCPDSFKKISWISTLGPYLKFESSLGEKYLPQNKELWRNLTTFLLFNRIEQ